MYEDNLLDQAIQFTEEMAAVSVSSSQRKFLIGYSQTEKLLKT